jgi:hydrogenase maturation factor
MCLAVPMKITRIDGFNCTCEARGIEREVSLFMLPLRSWTQERNNVRHMRL